MLPGQRRSQRCHRIVNARAMKRYDIGIAFHHNGIARSSHSGFRLVKAVEHRGLMEQRCFLGIQVLRLTIADNAPAKCYAIPLHIANGKHDAVVESIAHTSVIAPQSNVCFHHFIGRETLRAQMAH